jgi:putative ABC transport system ATP-binding protein
MEASAMRLRGLVKHYRTAAGLVRAVDGIDLDVEPASSLAIVGPSGCGKSTLLGLVGALEPPTGGQVWVGDVEVSSLSAPRRAEFRRTHIGFVFQSYDLLPFLTAAENVAFQLALQEEADDGRRSRDLLDALGLAEHADKLPDQLSGGQRQRVGIARALVHRPSLILADEPTGELDSENSAAVMDLLLDFQRSSRSTLIVVTHDPDVAGRLGRIVGLRDGSLAVDSSRTLLGAAADA